MMRDRATTAVGTAARRLPFVMFLVFGLAGCAPVQFVTDYDAATFDEILRVAKTVDRFYGDMLEAPQAQRPYAQYADRYVELETDIRSLWVRNQARPLNTESTKISKKILEFWVKYKAEHKEERGYDDGEAKLDRSRFSRLFAAAANAEIAKKLEKSDTDTTQ